MNTFITKKRDLTKEIQAIYEATRSLDRGTFVPHDQITELTGIDPKNKLHGRLVKHWKNLMLDSGIAVECATPLGTGYRLLTKEEQLKKRSIQLQRQGDKRHRKAAKYVAVLPADQLDDDELRFQAARLGQFSELKNTGDKQRAELSSWISNPKLLPRLPERAKLQKS